MENAQDQIWKQRFFLMSALCFAMTASNLLEQVLAARHWTLEKLAKRIGYEERTLKRVQSGELKVSGKLKKRLTETMEDDDARINEKPPSSRFASSAETATKKTPMVRDVTYEAAGEEPDHLGDVLKEISSEVELEQLEKMLLRIAKSDALQAPARQIAMDRIGAEIRARKKHQPKT